VTTPTNTNIQNKVRTSNLLNNTKNGDFNLIFYTQSIYSMWGLLQTQICKTKWGHQICQIIRKKVWLNYDIIGVNREKNSALGFWVPLEARLLVYVNIYVNLHRISLLMVPKNLVQNFFQGKEILTW